MKERRPNPFEEMQHHQIRTYFKGEPERKIKSGLDGTLGTVRFLGNVADVYICRLMDTVVGMARSEERDEAATGRRLDPGKAPNRGTKYPNL